MEDKQAVSLVNSTIQSSLDDDVPSKKKEKITCKDVCNVFIRPELTMQTFYGVVLGFSIGAALRGKLPEFWISLLKYPGEIFINALKMVVIPMIICDMVLAVIKLGDINKIKRIGRRALTYYLITTFLACVEGLIMVEIFQPGMSRGKTHLANAKNQSADEFFQKICQIPARQFSEANVLVSPHATCYDIPPDKAPADAFFDLGRSLIPPNIAIAFVEFNILGLIFFIMLYAFYVAKEDKCVVVKDFFEVSDNAFMAIIKGIIWWTPLGIFSLIIGTVLKEKNFWSLIVALGGFVGTTACGICLHLLVVYPALYAITTRCNPYKLLSKMTPPMMTAFATSSSAATLPITIKTAEKNGVHKDISKFMIPLGATINMDGTAIYFPIAIIFIANSLGIPLNFGKKISISLVSAMVSIGAAPIPSAGLVYLILIMNAVGLPVTGDIGYVLSIDWLLDRMQTACNVTGDGFGACVLEHFRSKDIENNVPGCEVDLKPRHSQLVYTSANNNLNLVDERKNSIEEH